MRRPEPRRARAWARVRRRGDRHAVTHELYGTATPGPVMADSTSTTGTGQVRTHLVDAVTRPCRPRPSWGRRFGGTFAMVGRGLPYAVGGRRTPAPASTG